MFEFKYDETVEFLRTNEPEEGYSLSFSGGKDSIVMYDICKRAGIKLSGVHMAWTHIDPPELYDFIRKHYPEVQKHYPKITFWQGILKKGVPFRNARWCCDVLKKAPLKNTGKHVLVGIRAEESARRSKRARIDLWKKTEILYKPIFYWSEGDIWCYIEGHNLPYPDLYDKGFDRLGCVVCPFLSGGKIVQHATKWPKFYAMARRCAGEYYDRREMNPNAKPWRMSREEFCMWPDWPKCIADSEEKLF